jgi:AraC-like DNA-binding protein
VDALSGLLAGPRAHGAFLLRTVMTPPWALRIQDRAALSVVAVVRGSAWIGGAGGPPVELREGDVALARGPDPYVVADAPESEPQIVIHPGQRCTTVDGRDLHDVMALGVRTWGNDPDGEHVLLTGTYETTTVVGRRLLGALPPLVHVRRDAWRSPLVDLLAEEIVTDRPGQDVVLDRLLDLVAVHAVRAWFDRPDADPPRWYRAHGDPVVGRALQLMHHRPEHPWTLASLAAECGASRATLARRFRELVGETPMGYLTSWRLTLAADLLREPGTTIGAVAARVGYGSAFSLSTAFKRHFGVSPREHRRRAPAAGTAARRSAV